MCEEFGGVGFGAFSHLFGCALCHDGSALSATFGSEVDDVVGTFNDVEVVLNDNHSVPLFHQHIKELGGKVKDGVRSGQYQ